MAVEVQVTFEEYTRHIDWSLTLLGRQTPAPSQGATGGAGTVHNEHADVAVRGHTEAATRKELPCLTRL